MRAFFLCIEIITDTAFSVDLGMRTDRAYLTTHEWQIDLDRIVGRVVFQTPDLLPQGFARQYLTVVQ